MPQRARVRGWAAMAPSLALSRPSSLLLLRPLHSTPLQSPPSLSSSSSLATVSVRQKKERGGSPSIPPSLPTSFSWSLDPATIELPCRRPSEQPRFWKVSSSPLSFLLCPRLHTYTPYPAFLSSALSWTAWYMSTSGSAPWSIARSSWLFGDAVVSPLSSSLSEAATATQEK